MQRERQGREDFFNMGDPFSSFRGFGGFPSLFGGRDPFDDPFFTRPFGSMFSNGVFGPGYAIDDTSCSNTSKGLVIEELDSDDEGGVGKNEDTNYKTNGNDKYPRHDASIIAPSVEHPDDDAHENKSNVIYRGDRSRAGEKHNQGRISSVQSSKVTCGGVDGAYYTSTRTRRTDNDGVVLEEGKEADATTGQATHRISRGILDKGHSVIRKLRSDGKVDTVQTLHNLNEDELAGFEKEWKGSGRGSSPGWSNDYDLQQKAGPGGDAQKGSSNSGGWALPPVDQIMRPSRMGAARSAPSNERTKKVVRINIE